MLPITEFSAASENQISSSAWAHELPFTWQTKFHTHTKQMTKSWLCIFSCSYSYIANGKTEHSGLNSSINLIRSNFSAHAATSDVESDRKVTVKCLANDLQPRNVPSGDCGWILSLQEWHSYEAEHKADQLPTRGQHEHTHTHKHTYFVTAVCVQERCDNEQNVTDHTRGMISRILWRKANAPLQYWCERGNRQNSVIIFSDSYLSQLPVVSLNALT
jgi:hypothetical protein